MLIAKDKVVKFHYRLSEPDGQLIEDSHEGDPMVYLHGHRALLPALEEALVGKQTGEQISVTLAPEQAYGVKREDAVQRISLKQVTYPTGKSVKFKPGMLVHVNTDRGPQQFTVAKVGLKTLDIDTNHILAGKTLKFEIDVVDVREATPEEIEHGHVHGDGGHHH